MACLTTDDGGIETLIYRMAKWYIGNGRRVCVLSTKKGSMHPLLLKAGCKMLYDHNIVGNFSPASSLDKKIDNYANLINNDNIAAVIGFCAISSYIALGLAIKLNTKCIAGIFHPAGYASENNRKTHKALLSNFAKRNALFSMNEPCLSSHERFHKTTLSATIIPLPIAGGEYKYLANNLKHRIVSIGRLADFKTYNLYMLDVISQLLPRFPDLSYTIYGDGPLATEVHRKINKLGLINSVSVISSIKYDQFENIIPMYDLHVGMGTSLLDMARFGMPSLVAAPFVHDPITCGFLYELPKYSLGEVAGDGGHRPIINDISEFFSSNNRDNYANKCRYYVFEHYAIENTMLNIQKLIDNSIRVTTSDLPKWSPNTTARGTNIYASLSAGHPFLRQVSKLVRGMMRI